MRLDRILRIGEVTAKVGLSKSTIYAALKNNAFPRPLRLGRRAVGWRQSDLNEWLENRQKSFGWNRSAGGAK
ncbi:helix-turn-helix transcriptional regulator [Sphingobium sp. CR28]|uniref:helix-turn-helix transcriptional regulator n=1 Tax=Sphingobium sp. CR28 TaxID=3400272 RepID=UPI003FF0A838